MQISVLEGAGVTLVCPYTHNGLVMEVCSWLNGCNCIEEDQMASIKDDDTTATNNNNKYNVSMDVEGRVAYLSINDLRPSDSREYTCCVSAGHSDRISYHLKILHGNLRMSTIMPFIPN